MYYKEEISHLVEQEYQSLAKEILNETIGTDFPREESETETPKHYRPAFVTGTKLPLGSLGAEQKTSVEDMLKSILGNKEKETKISSDNDFLLSSKPIVPDACHPGKATSISARVTEESATCRTAASNKEISHLLAQFPLKHVDSSKAPDNQILMEETRVIKDFLNNSIFSSADNKAKTATLSSTPQESAEGQAGEQKKQLPVFAKICSKPDCDELPEDLVSRADGKETAKEPKKTKEDSGCLLSQLKGEGGCLLSQVKGKSGSLLSQVKGEGGCLLSQVNREEGCCCSRCLESSRETKQKCAFSSNTPKKSVWPPEKNIMLPSAGAPTSAEGPQAARSKVEPEVSKLKVPTTVPTAAAPAGPSGPAGPDKNNLKYSTHVFTTRTSASITTQSRPFLLNYPPPPMLPNHSNFAPYQQGLFQQRPRMPFPQNLHPQLGCFSRQITPYNHQQIAQQLFRSSYTPLLGYFPFIQPDYSFQQRNSPKTMGSTREPPPMAGDGPQFLFPQLFGFNPAPSAPVISSQYFSSTGNNGFTAEAFFLGHM